MISFTCYFQKYHEVQFVTATFEKILKKNKKNLELKTKYIMKVMKGYFPVISSFQCQFSVIMNVPFPQVLHIR